MNATEQGKKAMNMHYVISDIHGELDKVLDQYKDSSFYEKYKDSYISDIILRDVFKCDIELHRLYGLKTYSDIYRLNVDVMRDLISLFADSVQVEDENIFWKMINAFYLDPDSCAIKELAGIDCSADGLFSIKRIYRKYGLSEKTISEYERYRMRPIFFFPRERNGINMSRASVFGDKIDHTLFDMKEYYQGNNNCKLAAAYKLPKTSKWLEKMGSFEDLVKWYGIKGIFVNENYEVYDLENGDGGVITDYSDEYSWWWSDTYYLNLRSKIDSFMELNNN